MRLLLLALLTATCALPERTTVADSQLRSQAVKSITVSPSGGVDVSCTGGRCVLTLTLHQDRPAGSGDLIDLKVGGVTVFRVDEAGNITTGGQGGSTEEYEENLGLTAGQAAYTLAHTPLPGTLRLYRNGLRQAEGDDYTIAGSTVTFLAGSIPQMAGDAGLVDYKWIP